MINDALRDALRALYAPTPTTDIDALNRSLLDAQASDEAWTWLDALLSSDDPSFRFFGAATLQAKVSRDLPSLPDDAHDQLKASALRWLAASALAAYPAQATAPPRPGERAVMRKLAAAIVTLAVRLHPSNAWPDWLSETLASLAGAAASASFECFTVILEEVTRASLSAQERVVFDQRVRNVLPQVIDAVVARLSGPVTDDAAASEINAALRCISAALSANDLPDFLLDRVYALMLPLAASPSTSVAASSTLEDVIGRSKFMTPSRTSALCDVLASDWSAQWLSQAATSADVDEHVLGLVKLLAATIDQAATDLAAQLGSARSSALLERLIAITSFPGYYAMDEEVSELALPAWTTLYEALVDEGRAESVEAKTIFAAVANALRVKGRLPADEELRTWPRDIRQRFQVHRNDALRETFLTCYYVLRSDMLSGLLELARSLRADADRCDLEATLFALSCIGEGVSVETEDQLGQLFTSGLITSITLVDISPRRLGRTALALIGVLAVWLHHHQAHLLAALQFVVSGLLTDAHSQPAARALRKLCTACPVELGAHIGAFAGLLGQLEGRIPQSDFVKVLASVAAVVQALPPDPAAESALAITGPVIERLHQAVGAIGDPAAREACLQQLGSIAACASGLTHPEQELLDLDDDAPATMSSSAAHPALAASQQVLLDCLQRLAASSDRDLELVQAVADTIRASTSSTQPTPVSLDPLSAFELCGAPTLVSGLSGVLWLPAATSVVARLAKSITADDAARQSRFEAAVARCFDAAFGVLSGADADPELLPSLLDLAIELIRVAPTALAPQTDLLSALVACATAALRTQERITLHRASATGLVHESGADAPLSASFRPVLLAQSRDVLGTVLAGIAGAVPESSVPALAELLHAFVFRLHGQTRLWLGELLAQPGFPSPRLDAAGKTRFLQAVVASRALKKVRTACDELSAVSRGQQNAYASSTPEPTLY